RSLGLSRPASALAGLLFGLSGYTLAHVENINQLNALAWLPAMLWLYDAAAGAASWRGRVRWGAALAVAVTMALLAGHTQTTFIDLAGLALYAAAKLGALLWSRPHRSTPQQEIDVEPATEAASGYGETHPAGGSGIARFRIVVWALLPILALFAAVLLSAAQLLPTLELNRLGLRTGGLPYRQAVSFSLRPRLLAQTILPPLAGGLAGTFGSEGYAEFAGWLAVAGLVLAGLGLRRALRRGRREGRALALDPGTAALVALAVVGFLLALGVYNPLYYLLWRFVPGFALFRAPARWLALYTLGVAGLAGAGLDALLPSQTEALPATPTARGSFFRDRPSLALAGAVMVLALLVSQQLPRWPVLAGWLAAGLLALALCQWGGGAGTGPVRHARRGLARGLLMALVFAELWRGDRALPFTLATAPAATDGLRSAPAALLAATGGQPPAGRDRFLSLSNIQFDPGDLAQLRRLEGDRLSTEALDRFVRSAKQMEVLAPNLSLLLQLPAVDGYDGGILPLDRYVKLQSLFLAPGAGVPAGMPARSPLPDGRLREQLRQIPPDRLLDLTGTRYVITDKQNDLWAGDVYYDLEQAVTLTPGQTLTLDLSAYPAFSATTLGIVSSLTKPAAGGGPAATITITGANGGSVSLDMAATDETGWAQATATTGETVARTWPDWMGPGHDDLALKNFPAGAGCAGPVTPGPTASAACPITPRTLTISVRPDLQAALVLRGLTLIDRRTASHQSVTLSPRGDRRLIYSGDVKIYERTAAAGRAWLVHDAQAVAGDAEALARLAEPDFDPRRTAIVVGSAQDTAAGVSRENAAANGDTIETFRFDAENIVLRTIASRPALLVLADAGYPGWEARVDGRVVPILPADLLFRAVAVPAGSHEITFAYQPASWRQGRRLSLIALALLATTLAATFVRKPRQA
ncbi:MAG TPA: hypothetical protein VGA61_10455, partial [Anaerolineae bacterium]